MEADTGQALPANPVAAIALGRFLEQQAEVLLGTLHHYVVRADLARGMPVREVANELLSELVVEALAHADRFDPARSPKAWLLGIAANLVKRRQVDLAKRARREPLARDLASATQAQLSEDDLFDWLAGQAEAGPEQDWEADERARLLLRLVPEDDREVLRLAVVCGVSGDELAERLNVKPGAARVRLHRALARLATAVQAEQQEGQSDG